MKKIITKEFIIKYLQDYYEENNEIPKSLNKKNPFCAKTVYNKFGSWDNALIQANIPLYRLCEKNFKKG